MSDEGLLDGVYHPRFFRYSRRKGDYWALADYQDLSIRSLKQMLKKRGSPFSKTTAKDDLIEYLHLLDRGLPSYNDCNNAELRKFLAQRHLTMPLDDSRDDERIIMIDVLKQEDRTPKFSRFMRLPSEMRDLIYDFYFAFFVDEPLASPVQPPLTATSRAIRQETLPLFYSRCVFRLSLGQPSWSGRFAMSKNTMGWIQCTKETNIAEIQKLQVHVIGSDPTASSRAPPMFLADVDFTKEEGNDDRFKFKHGGRCDAEYELKAEMACAQALEGIVIKPGQEQDRKLTKEDFYIIRFAMERAFSRE